MLISIASSESGVKYTGTPSAPESSEPLTPMEEVCNFGFGLSSSRGMGLEKYYWRYRFCMIES